MSGLWVTPEELEIDDLEESEFAMEAAKVASYILWAMSGRKFSGVTTVTERYVRRVPRGDVSTGGTTSSPVLINGDMYNIAGGLSPWVDPQSRVNLRGKPVIQALEIKTPDGAVLDQGTFMLVEHSTVQFGSWGPDDVTITYEYGAPPPTAGRMAARALAIEFIKLWSGDESCALPERVTSVSRAGISYSFLDQQEYIEELRTGIYAIDLFLKAANPDKARARARVFSPDIPRARRTPASPLAQGPYIYVP